MIKFYMNSVSKQFKIGKFWFVYIIKAYASDLEFYL